MKKYTFISKRAGGKGLRYMIEADDIAHAHRIAIGYCRSRRISFIALFPGHMAALRYLKDETATKPKTVG